MNSRWVWRGSRRSHADCTESQFSETIYATNADGSLAIGNVHIFDGVTFSVKAPLPISTTVLALSADYKTLYLYDINTSRIYIHDLTAL